MGSLLELLGQVREIPSGEFSVGKKAEQRPEEMALCGQIISTERILELRSQKVGIRRRCQPDPFIHFQVINGRTHNIVVRLTGDDVEVTDSGELLPIKTVEDLRYYILKVAKKDH